MQKPTASDILKTKYILLVAVISYPLAGIVSQEFVGKLYDPLLHRFILSFICLVLYFIVKFIPMSHRKMTNLSLVMGIIFTTHQFLLLYKNDFHDHLMIVYLLICAGSLLAVLTQKAAFILTVTIVALNLTVGILTADSIRSFIYHFLPVLVLVSLMMALQLDRFHLIKNRLAIEDENKILLQSLSEGILVVNNDGKILTINSHMLNIFHMSEKQLLGTQLSEHSHLHFLHEDHTNLSLATFLEELKKKNLKKLFSQIIGITKKNAPGEEINWYVLNFNFIEDNEKKYIVISFADITNYKQAQEELLNQKMKLSSQAKLASLGEMAGGIAHEINNPLLIISGRIQQLKRHCQNASTIESNELIPNLDKIEKTTIRISQIVKSMKNLSRNGENDPFLPVNLKESVADTLMLVNEKLNLKGISTEIEIDEEIYVEGRFSELSQVFLNFISNSVDAIESLPTKWIQIRTSENPETNEVIVNIKDSGSGIPEEVRDKIFNPFFTTKPPGQGTGLGLSISKRVIEKHNGTLAININSENTCFEIRFPIYEKRNKKTMAS